MGNVRFVWMKRVEGDYDRVVGGQEYFVGGEEKGYSSAEQACTWLAHWRKQGRVDTTGWFLARYEMTEAVPAGRKVADASEPCTAAPIAAGKPKPPVCVRLEIGGHTYRAELVKSNAVEIVVDDLPCGMAGMVEWDGSMLCSPPPELPGPVLDALEIALVSAVKLAAKPAPLKHHYATVEIALPSGIEDPDEAREELNSFLNDGMHAARIHHWQLHDEVPQFVRR